MSLSFRMLITKPYSYIWKILHFTELSRNLCLPPALEAHFPIFLVVRKQAPELCFTNGKFTPVFEPEEHYEARTAQHQQRLYLLLTMCQFLDVPAAALVIFAVKLWRLLLKGAAGALGSSSHHRFELCSQ